MMKSIKKKSQHKSNWKTIFVIENDDLSIYELNDKGRLSDCFSKQKYRNIRFCYEKLILDSIKKQKKKKQSQPDQKFSNGYSEYLFALCTQMCYNENPTGGI